MNTERVQRRVAVFLHDGLVLKTNKSLMSVWNVTQPSDGRYRIWTDEFQTDERSSVFMIKNIQEFIFILNIKKSEGNWL